LMTTGEKPIGRPKLTGFQVGYSGVVSNSCCCAARQ